NQFGNSGDKGGNYRTTQRHRFHQNNRQSLGETRKDECASLADMLDNSCVEQPSGDADPLLEPVPDDECVNVGPHLTIADKHELELDAPYHQLTCCFEQQQLSLLSREPSHAHQPWDSDWRPGFVRKKGGLEAAMNHVHFVPGFPVEHPEQLASSIRTDRDHERASPQFFRHVK